MQGRELQNRFKIGPLLGRGAQGEVYRLFDRGLPEQKLIIKIFAPTPLEGQQVSHWIHEIRYAMGFSHPALLTIFDTGLIFPEKRPYYIAEYFESKPLYHFFKQKLKIPEMGSLATQMLSALSYLHRSGLLHMDIKPSNVLLSTAPSLRAKLIDFGSVRELRERRVGLHGTPHYLSPAVIRGHAAREADDLYALGVVLFQTLSQQQKIFTVEIEEWLGRIRLGWHPFSKTDFGPCGPFAPFIKALLFRKYDSAEQAQRELREYLGDSPEHLGSEGGHELSFPKVPFPKHNVQQMTRTLDDIFSGRSTKNTILVQGQRGIGKSTFCRDVVKNYANQNGIAVEVLSGISKNSAFAAIRTLTERAEAWHAFSGMDPLSVNQTLVSTAYRNYFFSLFCDAVAKLVERRQKMLLIFESVNIHDLPLFELLLHLAEFSRQHQLKIAVIILMDCAQRYQLKNKNLLYENCYLQRLAANRVSSYLFFPNWTPQKTGHYLQSVLGKNHRKTKYLTTLASLKTPGELREFLENSHAQGNLGYSRGHWSFRKAPTRSFNKPSQKDFLRAVLPYLPEPISMRCFEALFVQHPALRQAFVELVQDKLLIKDEDRYFWVGKIWQKPSSSVNERALQSLATADPINLLPLCRLFPTPVNTRRLLKFLETFEETDQYLPHEQVMTFLLEKFPTPEFTGRLLYHLGRIFSFTGRLDKATVVLRRAEKALRHYPKHRFRNAIELANVYAKKGAHQKIVQLIKNVAPDGFSAEQKIYLGLLKMLAEALIKGAEALPDAKIAQEMQHITDPLLRGRFSLRYSQALLWGGQEAEAEKWIDLAISLFQKPAQPIRLARALRMKAKILRNQGFAEKALSATEEALALLKTSFAFPREELETLVSLFYLQKRLGREDLLEGYLCRIFAILPLLRESHYELLWPELLAQSQDKTQPEEALRHFRMQERMARTLKSPRHLYIALTNQAMLEIDLGHHEAAKKAREKAQRVFQRFGKKFPQVFQKYHRDFSTEKI